MIVVKITRQVLIKSVGKLHQEPLGLSRRSLPRQVRLRRLRVRSPLSQLPPAQVEVVAVEVRVEVADLTS